MQAKLTNEATDVLRSWFVKHLVWPYPTVGWEEGGMGGRLRQELAGWLATGRLLLACLPHFNMSAREGGRGCQPVCAIELPH